MDLRVFPAMRTRTRRQRGYALVIVAVIMGAVALVSAGLLAVAMGEFRTSESGSREMQARSATEGVLDLAAWQIKERIRRLPGNILMPIDPDNPGATRSALDLTRTELQTALLDETQPWVGRVGFPTTKGSGEVFIGAELTTVNGGIDELSMLSTVAGPGDQRLLEFLSDEAFAQRRLDYNYFPGTSETQVNLFAHGQVAKGKSDIRTSTLRKSYEQSQSYYGARERTRDDFSQITLRPHTIESPHDIAGLMGTDAYPTNMDRYWSVSYPQDPANPGRKIRKIGLIFDPNFLGLEDAGDRIEISRWDAGSYEPPFATITGPTFPATYYFEPPPGLDATTLRIRMVSDNNSGTGTPDQQYGFQLSGVRYYFDEEDKPAYFETSHPYDIVESAIGLQQYKQTIWSPFNLTEEEAGLLVQPGGSTNPPVIDPFNDPDSIRDANGNIIQAMRLEFSADSFISPGDTLTVVNANNGQPLATYTGGFGLAVTPWASRVRANTPLGIQLQFQMDGTPDPGAYGYFVSAMEYVNENGIVVRVEKPTQQSAHNANLGSLAAIDPTLPWTTTVFQPNPPGGAAVTQWSVHFNRATNLNAVTSTDSDYLKVDLFTGGSFETIYVADDGALGPFILTPGYDDIINLSNETLTLAPAILAVKVTPFLDDEGAYDSARRNYGFWVDTVSYTANNANDIDRSMALPGTMNAWGATAAYTNWGEGLNAQGEWWLTVPGVTELGVHFVRDQFRLAPGDAIDIYNAAGVLVKTIEADAGTGEPPIFVDPDNNPGGVVGELLADPNLPGDLEDQYGWVLVEGDSVRIVLRGDGAANQGYNGFLIDRLGYFANTFLGNTDRELTPADPDNYNERVTGTVRNFGEVN